MTRPVIVATLLMGALFAPVCKSAPDQTQTQQPLYRITVVERTTKAINYQYRSGPTRIDFRGTVLLPDAEGKATVSSKQGRTEIDADFDDLMSPARFGREYLTYVLWAITPDGRPHNLGEIVPNSSDDADLKVTTDLQAFALIVTAEPYSAVRQPSDVVVMQNEVRPDTVGRIEQVSVKYELMPRGHYVLNKADERALESAGGPKVSMSRYEELLALYQAQNAVGIAGSQNAAKYAPDVYERAVQLLNEAQQLEKSKAGSKRVVQIARQAAQTAEDARIVAMRRHQDLKLAEAEEARAKAEAEARQARADAEAARSRAEAELAARRHAETEAAEERDRVVDAQLAAADARTAVERKPVGLDTGNQTNLRKRLLDALSQAATTRDTPRGLVATIADAEFSGITLSANASEQVAAIVRVLSNQPGLRVTVEGHSDNSGDETGALQRAGAVRSAMVRQGLPASMISAMSWGASRPLVSNETASGREQNRRVEIVIAGDPIGNLAVWDRTYTIYPR
jgi:outer membrane protein OmpA-like peptidoglycan-associated protein